MSFVATRQPAISFSRNPTLTLLRRFEPMAGFDWHSLATLARLAKEITVPANRLLIRPPRRLDGVWYLCAGSLHNEQTGERFVAGSQRTRVPIYPGQFSLRSVTAARLLYFDADSAGLFHLHDDADGLDSSNCGSSIKSQDNPIDGGYWLETLAASPVLRLLYRRRGASGWQRWLRDLEPVVVRREQQLIAPGVAGDCFYVVQKGTALIEAAGAHRPLARVVAGGFFGEDAVLTGQPRNAQVHMPLGGRVLRGDAEQLRTLVADLWWALAREPDSWKAVNQPLSIPSVVAAPALRRRIAGLAKTVPYGLCVGQDSATLNLALLLLVHRGYRVLLHDEAHEKITVP